MEGGHQLTFGGRLSAISRAALSCGMSIERFPVKRLSMIFAEVLGNGGNEGGGDSVNDWPADVESRHPQRSVYGTYQRGEFLNIC